MATELAAPTAVRIPLRGRVNGDRIVHAEAIVPDDDFGRCLAALNWSLSRSRGRPGYAVRSASGRILYLHHEVYRQYHGPIPPSTEIDHIDRNKLNNLPTNLRAVKRGTNNANRGKRPDNTSGHVGVWLHKPSGRWRAAVSVDGKQRHLGYFADPREAALAVNRAYATIHPHVTPPNLV